MDVRHHPVGVVDGEVHGRRCHPHAVDAADQEHGHEAQREQHGRLEADLPLPQCGQPDEEEHAGGDGDHFRGDAEEGELDRTGGEHVVGPHRERQRGDQDEREHHPLVPEQRLAREHRDDLADDPPGTKDQHVHLGMPEEPEDVLPVEWAPAVGRVEERRAEVTVGEQHQQAGGENGGGEHHQERGGQGGPAEDGHAHHAHPWRPHLEHGHDEVDRAQHRGHPHDQQAQDPQILARLALK